MRANRQICLFIRSESFDCPAKAYLRAISRGLSVYSEVVSNERRRLYRSPARLWLTGMSKIPVDDSDILDWSRLGSIILRYQASILPENTLETKLSIKVDAFATVVSKNSIARVGTWPSDHLDAREVCPINLGSHEMFPGVFTAADAKACPCVAVGLRRNAA